MQARRGVRVHRPETGAEAVDNTSNPHLDFVRKCRHIADFLALNGVQDASEVAVLWTLAFFDEGDPTFCVGDWFESGWRDPELVSAAVRLCGSLEIAERCMERLGVDVGAQYDGALVRRMALAAPLAR